MAEFALIVPVFLLIFVGMVALGRAFFLWNDVNHEANETARWAAIDHNPYSPTTLQTQASNSVGGANVCLSYQDDTPSDGNPNNGKPIVGNYIKVRVSKGLNLGIRLPKIGELGTGFTIRGTSTMRLENLTDLTNPTVKTSQNVGSC